MKRKRSRGYNNNPKARAATIDAFLAAYERCGLIKAAARTIGVSHANHYHWLAGVPGYADRFRAAHDRALETLGPKAEAELVSRAVEGERTLVIDKGQPVEVWVNPDGEIVPAPEDPTKPGDLKKALYWEVKKSDGLLQFLLKSLYPERYGDKQKIDHTSGGKPIHLAPIRLDGDKEL